MLRATDYKAGCLCENGVKALFIDACIDCECDRISIIYAIEDVDKFITRMRHGDVSLWVLTNKDTFMMFGRVLSEDDVKHLQDINAICPIKKMYRIEREFSGYNVTELEFDN